jgi:phosphoglycolate phosphatase-like HAD superfamily hydrolase
MLGDEVRNAEAAKVPGIDLAGVVCGICDGALRWAKAHPIAIFASMSEIRAWLS